MELLASVLERLAHSEGHAALFGADEIAAWPARAFEALVSCGMLRSAEPAQIVECDGCERNCFKAVEVRVPNVHRPAHAFISCDEPEDMGRVPVELRRLQQFQITGGTLAGAVGRLLGFTDPPREDSAGKCWSLGLLNGEKGGAGVKLSLEGSVTLVASGRIIPLIDALTLRNNELRADESAVLESAEIGSIEWRKRTAKRAADARHDQPGGSRDKQQQIREIWASGKYSSRDICAEQESAALGMSYSAARKALRNTPEPSRR